MQFRRNNTFCPVCKKNGRSEEEYMSHNIRDNQNNLLCPILLNMICNGCGMNGHLRANCPNRTFFRPTGVQAAPPQLPSLTSEDAFPSMCKLATGKLATGKLATGKPTTGNTVTASPSIIETISFPPIKDASSCELSSKDASSNNISYSKIATKTPTTQLPTKPTVNPKYSGYVTISRSDWKKQSQIDDSYMRNIELQRESQIEPNYFMNNIYGGTMLLTKKQFEKYHNDIDTSRVEIIDDNNSDDDDCGYVDVVDDDDDEYEDDDDP